MTSDIRYCLHTPSLRLFFRVFSEDHRTAHLQEAKAEKVGEWQGGF